MDEAGLKSPSVLGVILSLLIEAAREGGLDRAYSDEARWLCDSVESGSSISGKRVKVVGERKEGGSMDILLEAKESLTGGARIIL
jgi:hypothetical protein